ncbi:MFS transporter [Bradyrhizobium sp. BR 10261]|uniref:MFS transporter n=1 Tax=Bradyrhizobium sp. BR 10261 TaxID=2749992 RepID=UPI001C64E611|nr:MFS transporter [Bradyrhizobium sp. BR 10261]MBW7962518.1 MFS transporter [Bradyrhizobium sp. BR 10261]
MQQQTSSGKSSQFELLVMDRVFCVYWSATLLMQLSTQTQTLIVAWFIAGHPSGVILAPLVSFTTNLPFAIFTIPSGWLADRYSLKLTHLCGQILLAIGAAVIGLSFFFQSLAVVALTGIFFWNLGIAVRGPAYQATIISRFPDSQTENVLSLHGVCVNVGRLVGPVLAGFLIAQSLYVSVTLVAFASCMLSIGCIVFMDSSPWRMRDKQVKSPEGSRILSGRFLHVICMAGLAIFSMSSILALLPVLVKSTYPDRPEVLGYISSCFGLGAIVGALAQDKLKGTLGQSEIPLFGALFIAYALSLATASHWILWIPFAGLAGCSFFIIMLRMNAAALQGLAVSQRARALSFYFLCTYGGSALGAAIWGPLAFLIGLSRTLIVGAGVLAVVVASVFIFRMANDVRTASKVTPG